MSAQNSNPKINFPFTTDYEYRSEIEICSLPLVHITRGIDPETGRPRIARGIIALGDIAVGVVSFGGISVGLFSLGGISIGSYALGGIALGGVAVGAIAVGLCTAVGLIAASLHTALGMMILTPKFYGLAAKIAGFFAI